VGSDEVRLVPSASDQPSATGAVTIPVPQTVPHYQGEKRIIDRFVNITTELG
jgi:hypothetical protein